MADCTHAITTVRMDGTEYCLDCDEEFGVAKCEHVGCRRKLHHKDDHCAHFRGIRRIWGENCPDCGDELKGEKA